MKSLIATPDRQVCVVEVPLPPIPVGGAIVSVEACAICGSDLAKLNYRSQPEAAVLGHEVAGTIQSLCPTYQGPIRQGDRVVFAHHVPCGRCHLCVNDSESMCAQFKASNIQPGGFSETVVLSSAHLEHTTFVIPTGVCTTTALSLEPLACVLKAMRRGGHYRQSRVLIIGAGYIGLLAGQAYQLWGDTVFLTDIQPERHALAQQVGLHRQTFLPETLPPALRFDVVFMTVANQAALAFAMERVREGGTLVLFADAPKPVALDISPLYYREIRVVPSYSPGLADLQDAADLIFNHRLKTEPLVTHTFSLDDAQKAFNQAESVTSLKVIITMKTPPVF